ncbi:uncharacterized protein LOC143300503 [Babylonia areolata]|uniref:uncharacterized protein LOC143300503 n=1 Tax=Babylonia areolata TaxID=304850 RepID=UPI003FD05F12
MVVTRKQAADSCQGAQSWNAHCPDVSPDSNLNLLASSASRSEALNSVTRKKTTASAVGDSPQQAGPSVSSQCSQVKWEASAPAAAESSSAPVPYVATTSSVQGPHGSSGLTAAGTVSSAALTVSSSTLPPSSSHKVVVVKGLAARLLADGQGDKGAGVKQYRIRCQTSQPGTYVTPRPTAVGVSTVVTPHTVSSPQPAQCVVLPREGVLPYHLVVPISHPAPAPTHPPPRTALLASTAPVKTSTAPVHHSSGPSPTTVILVSPPASGATAPSPVANVTGSSSIIATLPHLPPPAVTSSLQPVVCQPMCVGPAPSGVGAVVHAPSTPGLAQSVGPLADHCVDTKLSVTGHSVTGHSVSTAGPVAGHSVSQALFQLAHTAKADLRSHAQPHLVKAITSSVPARVTPAGLILTTGVRMNVPGCSAPVSTQASLLGTTSASVMTTGVTLAPRLQPPVSSALLVPEGTHPPPSLAGQPPTLLPTSILQRPQPSTSLAAPTPEARQSLTSVAPVEEGEGGSQVGEGEAVTWDRACTLKLIQLYKEHQVYLSDHHYKKKSVWELIATKLRQSIPDSPAFRWNHVENKWKNMTKKFRDCVNLNRRSSVPVKCNFFDEIAAIYNYNPDEDQRKAAEGLRALKSATHRHSGPLGAGPYRDCVTAASGADCSSGGVSGVGQRGGESHSQPEGVPLMKKKKYAHLDTQPCPRSLPLHSPLPPPPPPADLGGVKDRGVDIAGLLQRLREDRANQERTRMERLERMHQEKLAMFGRFLDILQQSKQTET